MFGTTFIYFMKQCLLYKWMALSLSNFGFLAKQVNSALAKYWTIDVVTLWNEWLNLGADHNTTTLHV